MYTLSDRACRRCGSRLMVLDEPFRSVDSNYIGPHDVQSQEIARHGKYEGSVQNRFEHVFDHICERCNCAFTIDQTDPWTEPAPVPSPCQTAPVAEPGVPTTNR